MTVVGVVVLLARLVVGATFIVMGWAKASDPVAFLKLVRQYDVVPADMPWLLNGIAGVLPWLEIVCGVVLIAGVLRRGAALALLVLLVGFSVAVYTRGHDLAAAGRLTFCDVEFDCGCGSGIVNVCSKLAENAGLVVLSLIILLTPARR